MTRSYRKGLNAKLPMANHCYYVVTIEYRIMGKFGELTCFEHLAKESLANYRSANRFLIVSTNLDGFSLANRRRFAKFAKLSPANLSRYMVVARILIKLHARYCPVTLWEGDLSRLRYTSDH